MNVLGESVVGNSGVLPGLNGFGLAVADAGLVTYRVECMIGTFLFSVVLGFGKNL